jgi:hypothetical protein
MAKPIPADEAGQQPEEPVVGTEARPAARRPGQDYELLAQQEVLGDQIAARAQTCMEDADEQT